MEDDYGLVRLVPRKRILKGQISHAKFGTARPRSRQCVGASSKIEEWRDFGQS
jgi:hypothetical protein